MSRSGVAADVCRLAVPEDELTDRQRKRARCPELGPAGIIASAADATRDWAVATSVDDAAVAQAFREAGGTVIEADQVRQRMKARWGGSGAAPPGRVGAIAAS
jgi:hypothetical protein